MCIAELIDTLPEGVRYWTKKSSLELPARFEEISAPGMDSGSLAIHLAHTLYPNREIICVGFDGVMRGATTNRYVYRFRNNNNQPKPGIHEKHRQTITELAQEYSIKFVHDTPDPELETLTYDEAISMVRA